MLRLIQTRKASQTITLAILGILVAILVILFFTRMPQNNQGRESSVEWVKIATPMSLIHVGSNDSFAITEEGSRAAKLVYDAIINKNLDSAKAASQLYTQLIKKENYGGEYSTLQWFCDYLLASDEQKKNFLKDKYVASFFDFFSENDFANLKDYLTLKYHLNKLEEQYTQTDQERKAVLEDTILFNNPRREEWEKTSKIMSFLPLKSGDRIADIGSGPGYYTFKFSQIVGEKGRVFAIDTVEKHLNYLKQVSQKYDIHNVETVLTQGDSIGVGENQADAAFLCSLYHNIYAMSKEDDRNRFVESIKKALKKNGTLIVIDNSWVEKGQLPYHGPYIAKELIIGQLQYYGFRFVKDYAPVSQRYVLIFKKV